MIKRVFCALLTLSLVLSFFSCAEEKTYGHCELKIPLSEDFYEIQTDNFDISYTNGEIICAILRISFDAAVIENIPPTLSAYNFGIYYSMRCSRFVDMQKYEDVDYCTYYDTAGEDEYFYSEAFYRSQNAYFVVLFATPVENEDAWRNKILLYFADVYFTD